MVSIWYPYGTMSFMPKDDKGTRINIRASKEVVGYLDDLARIGIHGKTRTEVAKTLISNAVERLIKDGFLTLRGSDSRLVK